MDRKTRAEAAVKLLRSAMIGDDQNAADFLASIIEQEELYTECSDDNGEPITSMQQFVEEIDADAGYSAPTASAASRFVGHRKPQLSPDQRYQQRMARLRAIT